MPDGAADGFPAQRPVEPVAAVLVAARDEAERIAATVEALRRQFRPAVVVVADDGSRDRTAALAAAAGARVVHCQRLGKGEALTAAERVAPPGALVLADADVRGDLRPLAAAGADLAVAAFARREGGGLGIAKTAAGALIELRAGIRVRAPLSGQRYLSSRARAACFPLARGFGCELRMTVDAVRHGLSLVEVELPLAHRPTGRDLAGFVHRGRQLAEATLAVGPLAVNHRGHRLPLVGTAVALGGIRTPRRQVAAIAAVALVGLADDLWSGPERGWREHLAAGSTTGVLKLVAIPAIGAVAGGGAGAGLVVGLSANALNALDTKPGRALKAFLLASAACRRSPGGYVAAAVLLLPYDLRERVMLGDAGSNALGAVLGLAAVADSSPRRRLALAAGLAGLNVLAEATSLGRLVERAPGLARLDRLGRRP